MCMCHMIFPWISETFMINYKATATLWVVVRITLTTTEDSTSSTDVVVGMHYTLGGESALIAN